MATNDTNLKVQTQSENEEYAPAQKQFKQLNTISSGDYVLLQEQPCIVVHAQRFYQQIVLTCRAINTGERIDLQKHLLMQLECLNSRTSTVIYNLIEIQNEMLLLRSCTDAAIRQDIPLPKLKTQLSYLDLIEEEFVKEGRPLRIQISTYEEVSGITAVYTSKD